MPDTPDTSQSGILQASEAVLRATLESMPDEVWITDAEGRILMVSDSVWEHLGASGWADISEALQQLQVLNSDGSAMPDEEAPLFLALRGRSVRDRLEMIRNLQTGELRWREVNSSPICDTGGRVIGAIAVARDITEHKRAERALQLQRQLLEAVINNIPAQINLIRGRDMRIELVNPAYQAIAPGKEMVGKTLDEVWPELERNFTELCRRVLATGEPYQAVDDPVDISRYPGGPVERRYFSWMLMPVDLPGGEGKGILNVSTETTDRVQAQQRERELQLEQQEFYRRTIFAATEGKLVITDRDAICAIAGEPVAEWNPASPEEVRIVRQGVQEAAVESGISKLRVDHFIVAVGEATSNAVKHAGGGSASLHRLTDGLMFVVTDHGPGIPSLSLPDVALVRGYSTTGTLGMGYKYMLMFADRVYLATGKEGTTVGLRIGMHPQETPTLGIGIFEIS